MIFFESSIRGGNAPGAREHPAISHTKYSQGFATFVERTGSRYMAHHEQRSSCGAHACSAHIPRESNDLPDTPPLAMLMPSLRK